MPIYFDDFFAAQRRSDNFDSGVTSDQPYCKQQYTACLSMVMSGNGNYSVLTNGGGGDADDDVAGEKQPDPDHIKMFVGQLPRSFTEEDVRKLFAEYGPIYQINMLRDKVTGLSKGCCFITFYQRKSALDAQNALHNVKTLENMHNPVQVKPADTENRSERKLFIGMISKKSSEDDIRKMFNSFGIIEECTVLRDGSGTSRGCAFVTFASRQNALNAIRVLHHSMTAEGCTSPLVVKMADTTKEKDKEGGKRPSPSLITPSVSSPWSSAGILNPLQQHYYNLLNPTANSLYLNSLLGGSSAAGLAGLGLGIPQMASFGSSSMNSALLNSLNGGGMNLQQFSGSADFGNGSSPLSHLASSLSGGSNPYVNSNYPNAANIQSQLAALNALVSNGNDNGLHALSNIFPVRRSTNGNAAGAGAMSGLSSQSQLASLLNYGNAFSSVGAASTSALPSTQQNSAYEQLAGTYAQMGYGNVGASVLPSSVSPNSANNSSKQSEGPEGANLFIYHLPPEYGDMELWQIFAPYGSIMSAKVFVDKQTGLSKCFGFVSYADPTSAQQAISSMNGYAIGQKRLKVQLKRSRDKPY